MQASATQPKTLHKIAGLSMLGHILAATKEIKNARRILVTKPHAPAIEEEARRHDLGIELAYQEKPLGTADAVRAALDSAGDIDGPLLVLYGDTPLVRETTLGRIVQTLEQGADFVICGFHAEDAPGYGRLLENEEGETVAIVEDDGGVENLELRDKGWKNAGLFGASAKKIAELLPRIGMDNPKGERYLTDIVALAASETMSCKRIPCERHEALGANNFAELAFLEQIFQEKKRQSMLQNLVHLTAPETVYFSHDTNIESGALVEPYVVFGTGVHVASGASIRSFSHIEGAHIAEGAQIGPFARLRPGSSIGEEACIGNFVEVKKSQIKEKVKINHLSYIGDTQIGKKTNIGAGVITCNYDGVKKNKTDIGENAFIGSNSALLAPVKIGDGAYVGSGSVINEDVMPEALSLARSRQKTKRGWAGEWRKKNKLS